MLNKSFGIRILHKCKLYFTYRQMFLTLFLQNKREYNKSPYKIKQKYKVACVHATLYIITPREFLLLCGFHIGVDILHVIILLETLNNLIDGCTLLVVYILLVVGDACELTTCDFKAFLLECLLDCTE